MNLLDVEASVQLYGCEPSWEEEESFASWGFRSTEESFASWGFRSTEESFAGWGFRSTVPVRSHVSDRMTEAMWAPSFPSVCTDDNCIPYSHLGALAGQLRIVRNWSMAFYGVFDWVIERSQQNQTITWRISLTPPRLNRNCEVCLYTCFWWMREPCVWNLLIWH